MRLLIALTLIVGAAACASKAPPPMIIPVAVAEPPRPRPSFELKRSWIVKLEDRRLVREQPPDDAALDPAFVPNLLALLTDADAGLRRRAALAVGRVGQPEGVDPLILLLKDP